MSNDALLTEILKEVRELLAFIVFPAQHHREFFGVPVEKSIEGL
jgi:hypothetical protein